MSGLRQAGHRSRCSRERQMKTTPLKRDLARPRVSAICPHGSRRTALSPTWSDPEGSSHNDFVPGRRLPPGFAFPHRWSVRGLRPTGVAMDDFKLPVGPVRHLVRPDRRGDHNQVRRCDRPAPPPSDRNPDALAGVHGPDGRHQFLDLVLVTSPCGRRRVAYRLHRTDRCGDILPRRGARLPARRGRLGEPRSALLGAQALRDWRHPARRRELFRLGVSRVTPMWDDWWLYFYILPYFGPMFALLFSRSRKVDIGLLAILLASLLSSGFDLFPGSQWGNRVGIILGQASTTGPPVSR